MTTLTKTLLAISLTGFAVGFTTDLLWGFGLPVGAVGFGLFMISKVFEKEVARFDTDEQRRMASAEEAKAHMGEGRCCCAEERPDEKPPVAIAV